MEGDSQIVNPSPTEKQHNVEVNNEAIPQDARSLELEILNKKEAKQKDLESTANLQELTNSSPIEKQNNINGALIDDAIPQDAELVQLEISKMKEARQKTLANAANLQRILDAEQIILQEKQASKMKLQKEIVQLQGNSDEAKHQYKTMTSHSGKMREVSKEIGNLCVQNESTPQQNSQDKIIRAERTELQKRIFDTIAKLEDVCTNKENKVESMEETVLNPQEIHQDKFETHEDACLKISEKLEVVNKELETLKGQSDELKPTNENWLNYTNDNQKPIQQLEEIWHHKQKSSDNLLEQMEEELRAFEQRKEEICNSLDKARRILQKKETEIEGVQKGIKNQTKYNKSFQEKLAAKIKEIADLRLQNDQLDAIQTEKEVEVASNEESLVSTLNSKLKEKQSAKALLSEERKILNKTEEQIKDAKQMNEEVVLHIEMQENIVAELKTNQNSQLEAVTVLEQEMSSLQLKLNNLKEEVCEWQTKFVDHESNMLEAINSKIAAAKSVTAEMQAIQVEEKEAPAAIIQEMELVKSNFDIKTAEETGDFEEKQKQLQQQIHMIEIELSHTRNLQVQLDDELQQLNNDCDKISKKIQEQELNCVFPALPQVDFGPAGLSPPPSVSSRAFDELSGSSAEGNVVTYKKILECERQKQLQMNHCASQDKGSKK